MQKNKPNNIEIFLALYGEMALCQSLPTILKWSHIKCPLPWALVGQTWPQIWPFLGLWRQSHLHPSPWIWITFYFRPISDLNILIIGQEAWKFTPNLSMHPGCWPWRWPPPGAISTPHPLADEHLCICLIVRFFCFMMQKNKPNNIEIFLALYGEMTLGQSFPTFLKWSPCLEHL